MTQLETAPEAPAAEDHMKVAVGWLDAFREAVAAQDVSEILALCVEDVWWRDLYALTWDMTAMHGPGQVSAVLERELPRRQFGEIELDERLVPTFAADTYVEALFTFGTDVGLGRGVIRLLPQNDGSWKAWTISTSLDALKDFPEPHVTIADAAKDEHNKPVAPGKRKTWEQLTAERVDFNDREPSVLILGGGHSGVMLAARLERLGVPTLIVDTYARAGDNWRLRYSNLLLHDTKWWAQFPYMPFPDTWPLFTPKEMIADWIEAYVRFLQLNLWTSSHVQRATYDQAERRWTVEIDRGGVHRTLRPNHLVFATGNHGVPEMPRVPGMEQFEGVIVHSAEHEGGTATKGKRVVVVGSGASAHDVVQDAYENGASVTMVQRSATYVLSQRNGVPIFHGTYYSEQSPPTAEADLLATSMPYALITQNTPVATRTIAEADKELIDGLERAGYRTTLGPNDAGMMHVSLVGGGYYIDKGAAQLIIDGEIRLQRGEVDRFTEHGVVYSDGTSEEADIVVFSTGYTNMREAARPVVGNEVTDQLAPVWGLDETGELRTTFRHSGHEKLWFMAGGFQQARVHSKHLAMMIKAMDEGALDPKINVEKKTTALD